MTTRIYWVVYVETGRYSTVVKRRRFDTESEARHVAKRFDTRAFKVTEEEVSCESER